MDKAMKTRQPIRKRLVLLVLFFVVGGAGVALFGWRLMREGSASEAWPAAEGYVKTSQVVSYQGDDGLLYEPRVAYTYIVNGVAYESETISLAGYRSGIPERAQAVADRYPAGARVTVRYDPAAPYRAVLVPGGGRGSAYALGGGIVFILVGLALGLRIIFRKV